MGQVIPLNVRWSQRFSTPVNVRRYVTPLIGCDFVIAICRGGVWTGHSDWHYKYDSLPLWINCVSAQLSDNTLWR